MSERITALQQMLEADPNNQLARYGLAMELLNSGKPTEAAQQFQRVLEINPEYSAAYYHGGKALEAAGEIDAAREVLEKGLEVTQRKGDLKTAGEIQAVLDLLGI